MSNVQSEIFCSYTKYSKELFDKILNEIKINKTHLALNQVNEPLLDKNLERIDNIKN